MLEVGNAFSKKPRINIVYYGPAVAGKRSNLYYIHAHLPSETRDQIVSQKSDEFRYIFLDFIRPTIGCIQGKVPVFRLQCFSGSVWDRKTNEQPMFLSVHAIVFIADSQIARLEANLEVLEILRYHLRQQGATLNTFPLIIQYNKRDLPNILPVNELQQHLNLHDVPYFEAIATQGIGVFETLNAVVQLAVKKAKEN